MCSIWFFGPKNRTHKTGFLEALDYQWYCTVLLLIRRPTQKCINLYDLVSGLLDSALAACPVPIERTSFNTVRRRSCSARRRQAGARRGQAVPGRRQAPPGGRQALPDGASARRRQADTRRRQAARQASGGPRTPLIILNQTPVRSLRAAPRAYFRMITSTRGVEQKSSKL